MDAVYPLGDGSLWENKEIQYSVKSVRKFAPWVEDIYTVGEDAGFNNIPHKETQHPAVNIWEKGIIACNSNCSDPFLFINDDHFLLKPIPENYPAYYAYDLTEYPFRDSGIKGFEHPYFRLVRRTREILGQGLFYNVHCPFVVHKDKFVEVFEKYQKEIYSDVGMLVKSTYLNGVEGVQMNDYKTRRGESYESVKRHCKDRHIFSTEADISEGAAMYLIELFGEP